VTVEPAEIAVIGGSGFYSFLADPEVVEGPTPYGDPSGPVTVGWVGERRVAFLPRHGPRHQIPPHRLNFRANLWALRELGVTRVIAPSAVGSLRPDLHPGDFVVLDQLVDRTSGRADTYLDGPIVDHVGFADPYCPELRSTLLRVGTTPDGTVSTTPDGIARTTPDGTVSTTLDGPSIHPTGTVVVIQGPRFSTRAESRWFRAAGWDVVNMTQYPEAILARELGLCYAGLALVTDYDTGVGPDASGEAVTMDAVMAVLADNVERTRALLLEAIPHIPTSPSCACAASGAAQLRRHPPA
jgi:5'-methylthioadenosine phosphorylase